MDKQSPPLLDGKDSSRCGKEFNNAICSINQTDWAANATLSRKKNGPCCSQAGWCGDTDGHCEAGLDFRSISEGTKINFY